MRKVSCVNIGLNAWQFISIPLPAMGMTTKAINYAVQRQAPNLDDWATILTSITPHEARARRLMRRQKSLRTVFQFRLVKLETQTTIIPLGEE
jgi:hypothetical protein